MEKTILQSRRKSPLIPTTENVNLIITNASKRYATIFTVLAEIGCAGKELERTSQNDIDTEQGIIRNRGCKGHASGSYKLKVKTAEMLRIYLHKNPQKYPFPKSNIMREVWRDTRKRASNKLCKPELNKIPLKTSNSTTKYNETLIEQISLISNKIFFIQIRFKKKFQIIKRIFNIIKN